MTPQEEQMISSLIQRVQNAPVQEKDPGAEQLLQQGLGRNPDSLYILAQTVLVQGYALEQAQKQLADARAAMEQMKQQQAQPPKHSTSFLGSIFGAGESDRPAAPPPPPPQYAPGQPGGYAPVGSYAAPSYAAPQPAYGYPAPPSGGGGFLRGAMQTAAGVAAGALAFEGVESLLHGFGGGASSSGFGSFGGGAPREEVINNYYGEDAGRGHEQGGRGFLGDDVEDHRNDTSGDSGDLDTSSFADTSDTPTSSDDDTSYSDDSGSDSSTDDSSFS